MNTGLCAVLINRRFKPSRFKSNRKTVDFYPIKPSLPFPLGGKRANLLRAFCLEHLHNLPAGLRSETL